MESAQKRQRSSHRRVQKDNCGIKVPETEPVNDSTREITENCQGNTKAGFHRADNNIAESENRKLHSLKALLNEQEEVLKNEQESFETRKQTAKERVTDLFQRFRKLLVEKETELLGKIDSEYTISGGFFADFISNIEREKEKVDDLLDNASKIEKQINVDEVSDEIDRNMDMRNDVLNQLCVPYLVLNEEAINSVRNLSFGELHENATMEPYELLFDNNKVGGTSEITQESDHNITEGYDDNATGINYNAEICEQGQRKTDLTVDETNTKEPYNEKETGAYGKTRDKVCVPSAPPIELATSPPPYWQAMGLEELQFDEQYETENDDNYDIPQSPVYRLPDNRLQLWHSFPIRRQHDRRTPLAVGLTWNHDRICLADRANMKIRFFSPNGQLITEMCFGGTEIHDVAFLDKCQGESRYAVTSPKSRVVAIISIDSSNNSRMIRKLTFEEQYSCISHGPTSETLVGVDVAGRSCPPVVNMFTYTGQILLSIDSTPSFNFLQYIKSVEVFEKKIIVLDWKVNFVSVFDDEGMSLGEYRGMPNYPLINPLDMTLDNAGNILILNGEFSNIHVIDQHCNFVEIIKMPRNVSSTFSSSKLISFDADSQRLAIARGNGDIAIFTFENGYDCLPQRNLPPNFGTTAPTNF